MTMSSTRFLFISYMSDPNMHATAHTLGRAHFNSSGFEGPWTWNPLSFDNGYGLARLERYGVCARRLKAILFAHISGTTRRCSKMTAPSSSCPRTLHSSTYVSTRFDRTPHPQFASPHTKFPHSKHIHRPRRCASGWSCMRRTRRPSSKTTLRRTPSSASWASSSDEPVYSIRFKAYALSWCASPALFVRLQKQRSMGLI